MRPYKKIALSGAICTGKSSLARALAARLGWKHYSTGQLFREYATRHNLSLEKGEEQNPILTLKIDNDMANRVRRTDHIVVDGWLAGMLLRDSSDVYRVLLTADIATRISRFARREQVSLVEAEKKIRQREGSVTQKVKDIYHRVDFFDPSHFNLVIDTTNISQERALELVCDTINK